MIVDRRPPVVMNRDCSLPCTVRLTGVSLCFLQVRAIISDFAVFITILTMVLVDYALGIPSPKLQVPDKFKVRNI